MTEQLEAAPAAHVEKTQTTNPARETAIELIADGFQPVRLQPGEKRPTYAGWTEKDTPPEMFGPQHGVGIRTGWASNGGLPGHSLFCCDIDDKAALAIVHEELAAEGIHSEMIDGRDGKPDSHFWGLLENATIPPEEVANGNNAAVSAAKRGGVHPGFRKRCWKDANKKTIFELLGTGQQAAVPPAIHTSDEPRWWKGGKRGAPAVTTYPKLRAALDRAAVRLGLTLAGNKTTSSGASETEPEEDEPNTPSRAPEAPFDFEAIPESERERRCVAYFASIPDADLPETGKDGESTSHRLARIAWNDFALSEEAAQRVCLRHIESRLKNLGLELWGVDGWRKRVANAVGQGDDPRFPRGCKLTATAAGRDDVPRGPTDPTRLGDEYNAECRAAGRNYVVKLDQVFRHTDGAYAPEFDGTFNDDVRAFLVRKAGEQFRADRRVHDRERAALATAEADARAAAEADPDNKSKALAAKRAAAALDKHDKAAPKAARGVTLRDVSEVAAAARSRCRVRDDIQPGERFNGKSERGTSCANGWLNFDTWQLEPHDPAARFVLARLAASYDPTATAPTWEKLLNEWTGGDADLAAVLQEVAGAALDAKLTIQHFTAIPGEGATGKSTFLSVLRWVYGPANVSAVPIDLLTKHQFSGVNILGKFANIVGDQGFFPSEDEGRLKVLTSFTDVMQFEAKNKQPFFAVSTAKHMFAANTLPTFKDNSEGVWRRLIVAPFRFVVPVEKRDPKYGTAEFWAPELSGILNWMLTGLKRLHMNGWFTKSAVCEQAKRCHREDSDPLRTFIAEALVPECGAFASNKEIAEALRVWCENNGYPKLAEKFSAITINRAIARAHPDATKAKDRDGSPGGPRHGWRGLRLLKAATVAPNGSAVTR